MQIVNRFLIFPPDLDFALSPFSTHLYESRKMNWLVNASLSSVHLAHVTCVSESWQEYTSAQEYTEIGELTIFTSEGVSLTFTPFIWHDSCQASFASFVSMMRVSGNGAWVTIRHRKIEPAVTRISFVISSKSLALMRWRDPSEFFLTFGIMASSKLVSSGRLIPEAASVGCPAALSSSPLAPSDSPTD